MIFTHFRQHGQICSMSKSKTCIENNQKKCAVWLGIYAVSVCNSFGMRFSRWTHELCVLHAGKVSATPVELREPHSTQNITICWSHSKSKVSVSSKKLHLRVGPSKSYFFLLHTQIIFAVPVVLGIYTCVYDIKKIYTQDLIYIHTLTI